VVVGLARWLGQLVVLQPELHFLVSVLFLERLSAGYWVHLVGNGLVARRMMHWPAHSVV
jgi:uncharacterized membrane protein YecN with MAPEG domain